jgi:hypothetical protein
MTTGQTSHLNAPMRQRRRHLDGGNRGAAGNGVPTLLHDHAHADGLGTHVVESGKCATRSRGTTPTWSGVDVEPQNV